MYSTSLPNLIGLFPILVLSTKIAYWMVQGVASQPAAQECEPRSCGNVTDISYPFWLSGQQPSYCRYPAFEVTCDDEIPALRQPDGISLTVRQIFYQNKSLWVTNDTLAIEETYCPISFHNISLDLSGHFKISKANKELFLTPHCEESQLNKSIGFIYCGYYYPNFWAYLGGSYGSWDLPASLRNCEMITEVPVLFHGRAGEVNSSQNFTSLLMDEYLVEWMDVVDCTECRGSNGECGYDPETSAFVCICRDRGRDPRSCSGFAARKRGFSKHIALGSVAGVVGFLLISVVLFLYARKRFRNSTILWSKTKNTQNIEDILADYGSLVPKRYKYSDLKKITKSFHEKLGQGGYGSVFKGTLQDGRVVAVKVLSNSKENGEDFINEVVSIGRTSHVNIVSLLGFCLDGRKRALVFEFLPGGSLEKYIYSDQPKVTLGWDRLYQIAVGIARGLEYLHRGCNMRIVHFDIKPHNILLDEDFCPKISDFGLAKLCPQRESIVSMADARGTIGYIAPEVLSRSFGVVSTKSDVYSYGMMVLEMVGGRKNVKVCADRSSEIYFPHWIYEHLDRDADLQAYDVTAETEETARKMTVVGLWCIQAMPANRPSMTSVVEMLEGRISDMEMPPKPYICSPMRSAVNSSS